MGIRKILDELVGSLAEIYGGFVCDEKQHILASKLNLIESENDCVEIAASINKIRAMSSVHYNDITQFNLCFGNTNILAYPINHSHWLFVSHSDDALSTLIQTTVDVAINQINLCLGDSTEITKNTEKAGRNNGKNQNTMDDLSAVLSSVEKAVIKIVGPIGSILIEDAMVNWKKSMSFSEDIEEIYPFIKKELDDDRQFEKFLVLVDG